MLRFECGILLDRKAEKKPSAPAAPDYVGAAQAQGQSNKEAAIASAILGNPNIVNPYGSQTVTYNKLDNGELQPTVTQNLSPEQQAQFDKTQEITGKGLDLAGNIIGSPIDTSGLPDWAVNAGQTGQEAILARMQPQLDRRRQTRETELANQGIMLGSEAYKNAQSDLSQAENDAYTQAALYGMDLGDRSRSNQLNEQLQLRELPLSEVNAIRTGQQVNLPGAGFQGSNINPADIYGALAQQGQSQMGQYNADMARASGNTQSAVGLGTTAALMYMLSDRRLKKNIERIGTTDSGIPIYRYQYINGIPSVGVMADEVEKVIPEAVVEIDGYKAVNYSLIR